MSRATKCLVSLLCCCDMSPILSRKERHRYSLTDVVHLVRFNSLAGLNSLLHHTQNIQHVCSAHEIVWRGSADVHHLDALPQRHQVSCRHA